MYIRLNIVQIDRKRLQRRNEYNVNVLYLLQKYIYYLQPSNKSNVECFFIFTGHHFYYVHNLVNMKEYQVTCIILENCMLEVHVFSSILYFFKWRFCLFLNSKFKFVKELLNTALFLFLLFFRLQIWQNTNIFQEKSII